VWLRICSPDSSGRVLLSLVLLIGVLAVVTALALYKRTYLHHYARIVYVGVGLNALSYLFSSETQIKTRVGLALIVALTGPALVAADRLGVRRYEDALKTGGPVPRNVDVPRQYRVSVVVLSVALVYLVVMMLRIY